MNIDPFANHVQALQLRARRNEVLAGNIANADTPNYKARDIDFAAAMATQQGEQLALIRTRAGHIGNGADAAAANAAELKYRVPMQPAVDGNTVETDIEQAAYAENVIGYQASLTFINRKIRGLQTAIKGSV